VVLAYGEWLKVRDVNGELAWTEAKGLSAKRNVIVKTPT
jgi:SH3-like domain-containing protein